MIPISQARKEIEDVMDYLKSIKYSFVDSPYYVANSSRFRILAVLVKERLDKNNDLTITDITNRTELAYKEVIRHLKILEEMKLVTRKENPNEQNHPVYIKLKSSSMFED